MPITAIPEAHCRIVERFGRPRRTQESGLAIHIPILEQIKAVPENWDGKLSKGKYLIKLKEHITTTEPRDCITEDNVIVKVSCALRWKIHDAIKAVYVVDDLLTSLIETVVNTLRAEIGKMELDAVSKARRALADTIIVILRKSTDLWGVRVISLDIKGITTNKDTSSAMLQQVEADRESRATISKAHGLEESLRIRAGAEMKYLTAIASVVGNEAAAKLLMASKIIEGYQAMVTSPASKVYIPNNINGIINFDSDTCFTGVPNTNTTSAANNAAHNGTAAAATTTTAAAGTTTAAAAATTTAPAAATTTAPAAATTTVPTPPNANTTSNTSAGSIY